jgi:hypothetical protein
MDMVQMKKIFIYISSFVLALIICELFVKYIIGFPEIGFKRKFYLKDIPIQGRLTWNQPYSKFWNVEGGNKIFSRNNFGLPGCDIKKGKKNIIIIGNSFMEATQVDRDKNASSIMQKRLDFLNKYQVINIAFTGTDPYSNWFRACFFSNYFKMDYVILVIESVERLKLYFKRYNNLTDVKLPANFGEELTDKNINPIMNLLTQSSFFSLIQYYIDSYKLGQKREERKLNYNYTTETNIKDDKIFNQALLFLLTNYKMKFQNFTVISLESDAIKNDYVKDLCEMARINFQAFPEMMSENYLLNGQGHLNELGNKKFGILLSQYFLDTISKSSPVSPPHIEAN